MKSNNKIIIGFIALLAIAVSCFLIQMNDFANGIRNDAGKSKNFTPQKLTDSTTLILGDTERHS